MSRATRNPDTARKPRERGGSLVPAWPRAAAVLVAGLAIALLAGSGTVRIPPKHGLLLAAGLSIGLIVVVLAAVPRPAGARAFGWPAALGAALAGAAAGHVLLDPGMPRVHDMMHPWGIWAYGRCVQAGDWWPTWVPYLGAGIPLLRFYGPLNFVAALPAVLAGLSPVAAFETVLFAGHVLSALAAYAGARLIGTGRTGALIAAAALAFAPWRLANFDYRGALGEASAFVFLPLVAAATLRAWRRPTLACGAVLALSIAGLVLTHLLSLFTLVLCLLPALAVQTWLGRRAGEGQRGIAWPAGPRAVALAWVLGLGLTAAWWVPAVTEIRFTAVEEATRDNPYYRYAEHGLSVADMASRRAWDTLRVSIPRASRAGGMEGEQMPFYVGAVLLVSACAAGWWSRRRLAWAPAAGALAGLLLSSAVLAGLTAGLPFFDTVRFPWRFLSPATVLAALALGIGVDAWVRHRREAASGSRPWLVATLPVALVAALIWDGAPFTGAADRIPAYDGIVHWHTTQAGWTHWEESMRPVAVDPVAGGPGEVVRVRDLALPPSDYATAVDLFFPAYYDWLTPEVYMRYWRRVEPGALAAAGVRYAFAEAREGPRPIDALPYATLRSGSGPPAGVPPSRVERGPGRIVVQVDPGGDAARRLLVREQAFPGWKARVDDGPWGEPQTRGGFLSLELPPGARQVELVFGAGTPMRWLGRVLSVLSLALLAAAAWWRRRRAPA
jgi:hypothetical protein